MALEVNGYKSKLFSGIVSILFFLTLCPAVFAATLVWQEQATVAGPAIQLGDLALLSGDDPDRLDVLRAVNMGRAAAPGQTSYLTGDILRARIMAAGIDPMVEGWTIPERVTVTTLSQIVPGEAITQKVTQVLMGQVPYPPADVTVKIRGSLAEVPIPVGAYEIKVKLPNGVRLVGPTQVAAEIWASGRLAKTIYLVCDVQVQVQAIIVTSPVAPHKFITPADITVEKRSLASLPVRALKDDSALKLYWTRRTISPGTVLTEDMLDIPPVVTRNSPVTITVDNGTIYISAFGLAMQDGRPGDIIRVQNLETKRIILAKVQAKGTVVPLGW